MSAQSTLFLYHLVFLNGMDMKFILNKPISNLYNCPLVMLMQGST